MAVRRILQLGDPTLRRRSEPVGSEQDASPFLADLRDTLHDFQERHHFGRGISAIQIGDAVRVIYLEFEGTPYCLINPELLERSSHRFEMWDDCFSFPELMVKLERSQTVRLRYLDEFGARRELIAEGPLSELVQHEMDHLDGVLAVDLALDRDSFMTRTEWLRSGVRSTQEESTSA